jgi:hypothetical protein
LLPADVMTVGLEINVGMNQSAISNL